MTNSNDRLDRIEKILEASALQSQKNSEEIAQLKETFRQSAQTASEEIAQLKETFRQSAQTASEEMAQLRETSRQLAQVAQTALTLAQGTRESIAETDRMTRRNAAAIANLDEKMEQYIAEGREHREFIATQVEGIKIETRRILQHLFGEDNNQ
jgi:methyl-accepting chemotaxis protein